MGEVIPYYDLVRPKRDTRKQIARMQQKAMVDQAALDAATRNAVGRIESDERSAALRTGLRFDYGKKLAGQAIIGGSGLYDLAAQVSRGNPAREASLGDIVETFVVAAKCDLFGYMTR